MRLNILAFAAGVLCLQVQPELPPWLPWALGGSVLLLPRWRWGGWPLRGLALLACLALGVAWAAWRAEIRLADQLPLDWEGRDIVVTGVVASLPQDFSQGTRFEFAVEAASTAAVVPPRINLSWYQGRRDEEVFNRLTTFLLGDFLFLGESISILSSSISIGS